MNEQTLGQRIRSLREAKDLSLRDFAKLINVTPPHISDIELGRRNPSKEVLERIAENLDCEIQELSKYDLRKPIAEIKRLYDIDPAVGFAFRTVLSKVQEGELTPEEIVRRLNKK